MFLVGSFLKEGIEELKKEQIKLAPRIIIKDEFYETNVIGGVDQAFFDNKIISTAVEKKPLEMADLLVPQPNSKEILVEVLTCGVCHTELDEIEGRLQPKLPIISGHKIVGKVEQLGLKATRFKKGDRLEDQDSPDKPLFRSLQF